MCQAPAEIKKKETFHKFLVILDCLMREDTQQCSTSEKPNKMQRGEQKEKVKKGRILALQKPGRRILLGTKFFK